jgi:DNA-binding MarR family transcriptional regulator
MTDLRRARRPVTEPTPAGTPRAGSSAAPTDRPDASASVFDALRALHRALRLAERSATEGLGLPPAQAHALRVLGERPARSLADLAERTHTDPSSASVVVQRLVELGLVTRTPAADDRRRTGLALTPAGRVRLRRGPEAAEVRLEAALRALGAGRDASLARQLGSLVSALREPTAPGTPATPARRQRRAV